MGRGGYLKEKGMERGRGIVWREQRGGRGGGDETHRFREDLRCEVGDTLPTQSANKRDTQTRTRRALCRCPYDAQILC